MSRKIALLVAPLALLGLLAIPARAGGEKDFKARLNGYEEVPAVSTTGGGEFRAKLDKTGTMLEYELSYADLSAVPTQAHIHFGQEGVNGGVSVWLCSNLASPPTPPGVSACPPAGTVTGTIDASDVVGPGAQGIAAGEIAEIIDAMRAGIAYANVHTPTFPGGEIRGQID
ncbi:MAG TPA: CHRD domain-containing protein [Actinomycetota bacterium]